MRKFTVLILIFIFALLPLSVSAETNYAKGLGWTKGLACRVTTKDGVTEFTNLAYSYSSGYFDIMPALKKAVDGKDQITVVFSGQLKATFKNEDIKDSKINSLIRASTSIKDPENWTKEYEKTLNGKEPFFKDVTSNALHGLGRNIVLKSDWTEFSVEFSVYKEQIYSSLTPNWFFCFDGIDINNVSSISVKNIKLTVKSDAQAKKTPPVPTKRPNINVITPAPTPTPTPSPTITPMATPNWKEQPIMNDMGGVVKSTIKISVAIIVVVGIIYLVTTFAVKKKK